MLMVPPAGIGVPTVTVPADIVEFKPPPRLCVGGVSKVVACTVHELPGQAGFGPVIDTTTGPVDVRTRKSATPTGTGDVVMSTTRNLSRVIGLPVLLVTVRRTSSVPNVELFPGSLVVSRIRLGSLVIDVPGSSIVSAMLLLR